MRIRLFWKILFSFWLTFICISEGVWLIFHLYEQPRHRPQEIRFVSTLAQTSLSSAVTALRLGGEDGLRALLASWPETERTRLTYASAGAESVATSSAVTSSDPITDALPPPGYFIFFKTTRMMDGTAYVMRYDGSEALPPRPQPGLFNIPPELMMLGIVGGLLFSSLLAWYLIAPVWRLRMGFEHLAQGKLDVRLQGHMGRRRDEIADLARDFDLMAERMQILVESRDQLLHDVSHELRSPLARQHMAIGLARQNPQRTPLLLERIEQESSRMDELVGELLTLSRIESGTSVFEEYFDLQGLVGVVVDNARFEAQADGVGIKLNMAPKDELPGISMVRGNAELFRRALENVVRNAMRHSPRGTSMEVKVFMSDNRQTCSILVTDHGPGVPEDSLEQIFEPFVRLKNTASHGTGLGLAIAKRAIAVHAGSIQASNCDNGGLRITIVLPLESLEVAESENE